MRPVTVHGLKVTSPIFHNLCVMYTQNVFFDTKNVFYNTVPVASTLDVCVESGWGTEQGDTYGWPTRLRTKMAGEGGGATVKALWGWNVTTGRMSHRIKEQNPAIVVRLA